MATFIRQHSHGILLMGMLLGLTNLTAQYAPPAGMAGTTAIAADSNVFVAWASDCILEEGWMDITDESLGKVYFGEAIDATQMADNAVVSLGDGGVATCFFDIPIVDGPGADFAVFENSFDDTFLELAFVEVSSDGNSFVRFGAVSLTQADAQIETFGTLDATKIYNLAGKYRGGYGTPFDLKELEGISGLDIRHIVAVRIVDVVGNILPEYARLDVNNHVINDPWPTAFETGGFDLDAVGVMHNLEHTGVEQYDQDWMVRAFPNPVSQQLHIQSPINLKRLSLYSTNGSLVFETYNTTEVMIEMGNQPRGLYMLHLVSEHGSSTKKIVKL